MNKKILSLAIAAIACAGTCAMAQNTAECCITGSKAACGARMSRSCADSTRAAALFEGITLSSEQQTKIAELRKARAEVRDKKRTEYRNACKEYRKSHLAEMKEVLTPEQYVVYLENIAVNRQVGRAHRNACVGKSAMRERHAHNKLMKKHHCPAQNEQSTR